MLYSWPSLLLGMTGIKDNIDQKKAMLSFLNKVFCICLICCWWQLCQPMVFKVEALLQICIVRKHENLGLDVIIFYKLVLFIIYMILAFSGFDKSP